MQSTKVDRELSYLLAWAGAACLLALASMLLPGTASAGSSTACPVGQNLAEYFGNGSLSGPAAFSRCEGAVDSDWGWGGPGGGVGPDDFSVRWSGRHSFAGGTYTFTATTDDGIRVRLDGELIIDAWWEQPANTYSAVRSIGAGEHTITVEYYERGGLAVARLGWTGGGETASCGTGQNLADYFGNASLSGPAAFSRCEGAIDSDWGWGGPGGGVGPDDFSVRWSGRHSFGGGTYTFTATTDDGIRVRLDGELIIDAWWEQPASTYSAVRSVGAGEHTITVEYYERGGLAVARLGWTGGAGGGAQAPMIAAAGDIACAPDGPDFNGGFGTATTCRQRYTSDLLVSSSPAAVLVLGDIQYEDGALWRFYQSYDPSWGRVRGTTRPVPGNHEYETPGASGYFSYFGAAAGNPAEGYYSFDVGAWHLVALNSNCSQVGCFTGSRQEQWLRGDLAAHRAYCTLAYTHHPRYSSGQHSDTVDIAPLFQALYDFDADVLLSGHDHDYERIAPSNPFDGADPARGIRQFVVGTGGKALRPFGRIDSQSEARSSDAFGVLELVLRPDGYDWRFVAAEGSSFADSGSAGCH